MEITSTDQLRTYLEEVKVQFESLQKVEGGTANFVWRMTDGSGKSIIIKHAEPYVATSGGQMPFPVERMDFENTALTTLPSLLRGNDSVVAPKLYRYDGKYHILMMEDGGPRTLKAAYLDESLNVKKLGTKLGKWLADLHKNTKTTEVDDNKTAKAIYRYSYANVAAVLQRYGHDPAFGERVNEQYGSLLESDNECLCHGDFWPGNVLSDVQKLTVIDWEMVRRGCGATDVGQFAAEAFLLERFKDERGLLSGFLEGYRGDRKLDKRFLQRVGVHMGVHLAFWPTRVPWGAEDDTRDCIRIGNDLMSQAIDQVDGWVAMSPLSSLL